MNTQLEKNIKKLPKEALFQLLLQVEPKEIKIVCHSKNPRVREICSSKLFQEAYKKKYPKKLLKFYYEYHNDSEGEGAIGLIGRNRDQIQILYDSNNKELKHIFFIPYNQIYHSTVIPENYSKKKTNLKLKEYSPMEILLLKEDNGEFNLHIGRENMVLTSVKDQEKFLKNYNQEVKEFLQSIEREKWWNPNIQFGKNKVDKQIMNEFYNQVIEIMKEVDLDLRIEERLLDIYYPKL